MCTCTHTCTHMYIQLANSLLLPNQTNDIPDELYMYMYTYMYVYMYTYMYIYVYDELHMYTYVYSNC